MAGRPIKLTIAALGGQGGGVLAKWLIEIAEVEGYVVQSTSVPGVAQRTGSTLYYLEFFPRDAAARAGREPVMALMPVPGDVDCVVASELVEAGRAVQRGLVTPERTTLIASSHRSYVIDEKMALGRGAVDSQGLVDLLCSRAQRLVLFDMDATAERHQSVISSVLLGALCGSGVLPFRKQSFIDEVVRSAMAVQANLAAFEDSFEQAQRGDCGFTGKAAPKRLPEVPERARTPALQPLLDRIWRLPACVRAIVLEGVRRTIDYQDPAYAAAYLDRLEKIAAVDRGTPAGDDSHALVDAVARSLARWMTFEDMIRVADLKTRAARFTRVREEIRAVPGQLFGITDFMKPRVADIAGTLPPGLGRWVLASPRVSRWLGRFTGGRRIRTGTLGGFLILYTVAGCRPWRRRTLRFAQENERIDAWLARIQELAADNFALALQLARAQTLIKGYGETYERGLKNFSLLMDQLELLARRPDGADWLERLQHAALADEQGQGLARELAALGARES
jgi:indolepyruvate ferredoxin oxidoreductase beta subunit